MVKDSNTRIMITIPKSLLKSLEMISDRQSTTVSKVIISMCERRANKLFNEIRQNKSLGNQLDLFEIAKTKWLD